jgi:hypothetical protein
MISDSNSTALERLIARSIPNRPTPSTFGGSATWRGSRCADYNSALVYDILSVGSLCERGLSFFPETAGSALIQSASSIRVASPNQDGG